MKITLESTTKFVWLNGVPTRIWEGTTDSGIALHAYIARVAVREDKDCTQFDAELRECRLPSPEVAAIPARLVL